MTKATTAMAATPTALPSANNMPSRSDSERPSKAVENAGSQLPSGIGKVTEIAMISAMMPITRSPRRRQNGQ